MSTTATMPCRVPPAGDASAQMARRGADATPVQRDTVALTVGEMLVLDHLSGRPHFGPLCRLCGVAA